VSNFLFAPAEVPVTIAKINRDEGNAAASGYGVVLGIGRSFARGGAGLFEILTWPIPFVHGTYAPVLPGTAQRVHGAYSEFPPELGNESKYPYVRDY
jgi:putative exosortase-associated protein (TIGR04073 family)